MADNRGKVRARATTPGSASFDTAGLETPCTVLDLSSTGACLTFRAGVTVPASFGLRIGSERKAQRVEVRWRRADRIGVAFLEPRAAPDVMAL